MFMRPKADAAMLAGTMLGFLSAGNAPARTTSFSQPVNASAASDQGANDASTFSLDEGESMNGEPDAPVPVGMKVSAEDTLTQDWSMDIESTMRCLYQPLGRSVRALVVEGECYGRHIVWYDTIEMDIAIVTNRQTGKPMLLCTSDDKTTDINRGFEEDTNTWWRYEHEADPAQYREHCLRVIALG